jgi:histidyl-tRNA synthetase
MQTMKNKIQIVKGTRDFYPEAMMRRNWLHSNMRVAAQQFGYQEYDGPFIETLDLYAAKSGEELIKEQSFVFTDRGGDQVTLRPELTPSLARMVATRQSQLPKPIRWWSFGPFWRYERPQKGRAREFYQWNVDLLGVDSPAADAELAAVGVTFFRLVGLTPGEIRLKFNNRRLMDAEIAVLGLSELKMQVFRLIDRREKMSAEAWEKYATELGLATAQFDALRGVLNNRDLWQKSDEVRAFVEAAEALGIGDFLEFDPSVIRGLDYYTGNILEAWDCDGEFRSILGGGRYDNLVGDVGGDRVPGVGFAMGDMVMGLVAEKFNKVPALRPSPSDVLVTTFDKAGIPESLRLSAELRAGGLKAEWYPEPAKLDRQLKYADATGVRFVAIMGPDEAARGQVTLKDLTNRTQFASDRNLVVAELKQRLASI